MTTETLNDRVCRIKGNINEINNLIIEYKPFIATYIAKITGQYMSYGTDDELSIGLIAFTEAISSYDSKKGSFLSFAQNVIKRRLIDYYRKEKRFENVTYIEEYTENNIDSDNIIEPPFMIKKAMSDYQESSLKELRRLEIEELKGELSKWNISFAELVDVSPKAQKTKILCNDIIKFMLSRQDLIDDLMRTGQLPIAIIEKETKVHRKKVERARKYIIAALLINLGDYEFMKEYVDVWRNTK